MNWSEKQNKQALQCFMEVTVFFNQRPYDIMAFEIIKIITIETGKFSLFMLFILFKGTPTRVQLISSIYGPL